MRETLADEEIETRRVGTADHGPRGQADDPSDTADIGDDAGDSS